MNIFIYLFIYSFIYLFVCLFIYLFTFIYLFSLYKKNSSSFNTKPTPPPPPNALVQILSRRILRYIWLSLLAYILVYIVFLWRFVIIAKIKQI